MFFCRTIFALFLKITWNYNDRIWKKYNSQCDSVCSICLQLSLKAGLHAVQSTNGTHLVFSVHLLPILAPSTSHMCSTQDCESGDHRHWRCCLPRHPRPRVLLLPSLLLPSQETNKVILSRVLILHCRNRGEVHQPAQPVQGGQGPVDWRTPPQQPGGYQMHQPGGYQPQQPGGYQPPPGGYYPPPEQQQMVPPAYPVDNPPPYPGPPASYQDSFPNKQAAYNPNAV